MIDLAAAQRAGYEALREATGAPCFVRLCMDHGALWVSDLPRRTDRLAPALAALETLGVKNEPDPETGLWRLDWTAESWRERLDRLPIHPPALPRAEALHPAYALCRLLMMHPAPVERQPLEQVREMAGRTIVGECVEDSGPDGMHAAGRLTGSLLRMGLPLAEGGGRVLADWITRLDAESKQEG